MNIPSRECQENVKYVKRRRSFFDDPEIGPLLDEVTDGERSVIVRMAVRHWYGLPIAAAPPQDANQLRNAFKQLMQGR